MSLIATSQLRFTTSDCTQNPATYPRVSRRKLPLDWEPLQYFERVVAEGSTMNNRFVRTVAYALAVGMGPALAWAAPEGVPCSAEPTDMPIKYGDVVTCEISPVGDLDLFRFEGRAQEKIVLQGIRNAWGPTGYYLCLELRGPAPADTPVVSACHPQPRMEVVIPASGVFTIRVTEFQDNQVMPYTLTLERVTPASPAGRGLCWNCTVSDRLDPEGDLDVFSFTGLAGDSVIIQATMVAAGDRPCVTLYGPTGDGVVGGCAGATHVARFELILPQSGPYTILVDEFSKTVLGYDLFLQCSGVCPSPPSPTDFYTVMPCRVFDTRQANGPTAGAPLTCGTARSFTIVGGTCGVPASAQAVSVNLTATAPTAQGNLRLFPAGAPAPLVSNLNYMAGLTRANNAVAALGTGGRVSVLCSPSGTTHAVLDVNGYFE